MQEVGGSSPPVPTIWCEETRQVEGTKYQVRSTGLVAPSCGTQNPYFVLRTLYFVLAVVSPLITITLPDGSTREVPPGSSVQEFASATLPQSVVKKAVAAFVDGKMVDLTHQLGRDATLRLVTPGDPEALPLYRHSTAHLLAAAVTNLYPGVQCGIGPAT